MIEDSPDDEGMALMGIEHSGIACRVTVLHDGPEAIASLVDSSTEPPTLIVLDFRLPKLNGLQVLARLRESEKTRLVPVVMFSSDHEERDLRECYRIGANSCVTKPRDPYDFVDHMALIIRYWLTVNHLARTDPFSSWIP